MITMFDPFGYDRILYTVRNTCKEEPEMLYDDGAATFFFYTKGKNGKCADEIRELLHFMESTQDANAVSSRIRQIRDMVSTVKHDERMKVAYMKSFERDELIRQEVRNEMQAEVDRAKAEAAEAKAETIKVKSEADEVRARIVCPGNAKAHFAQPVRIVSSLRKCSIPTYCIPLSSL
jgi:Asp-tRNA(Asn)/Glu-tRNA(Gln) amidotransferase A subunit family amidase